MKALILAGGFGTRLRPLTDRVPKSLLPIGNVPFLEHQIRLLAVHEIVEATLLTGYLAEEFDAFVRAMKTKLGVTLHISTEEKPLGTAGAVRSRLEDLDGTTIVLNGDVLTDLDLAAVVGFHRKKKAVVTIVLTRVDDARPYGLVPRDENDRVLEFKEKPAELVAGNINAGTYVLEPPVLHQVPPDEFWQFEQQLFPALLDARAPVYGYVSDAYWLDIGSPERYLQAHHDILSGRVAVAVDGTILSESTTLSDGTKIVAPTLLSHAPVGAGATLGPLTTIGPGARIGAGARVSRSVVAAGAVVGERAVLTDSVIGAGAQVDADAELVHEIVA